MYITAQGCRLRNDLYCVEWDVKLYHTIPCSQSWVLDLSLTYTVCKGLHEALTRPGPDLIICDEGHRIKNSHASISQALKNIRTKYVSLSVCLSVYFSVCRCVCCVCIILLNSSKELMFSSAFVCLFISMSQPIFTKFGGNGQGRNDRFWWQRYHVTLGLGLALLGWVAVWCSGNTLVLINAVALHRARLVLGWVTAFG